MRKYLSFLLCLLIGANVFAQNQVLKAVAATSNQNFKVAETPLMTKVSNTQAKSLGETYLENEAFYTNYDLQSNGFLSNRMYQNKNGDVAVVAMQSDDESSAAADRGTGYNFYKNGKILEGGDQFQKIEANATGADMRTGWPTIAPYGAEGEILVNHSDGLNYWVRTVAGEGKWDGPHAIPNPDATKIEGIEEGLTLSWARVVTTGENNDVVHIFAAATGSNGYYQFYVRSTDLQEWDVQLSPLAKDDLAIGFYAADDYAVASNGNYVSVVYCAGWTSHVMLYESNDQGLTWTSRMVWESPIHGLDWATDENSLIDQCYGPAHASVAIGKDGVSHVALSVGVYSREELNPNGYLVYYGLVTDGIAYWNDTTAWEYEVNGTDTIAIPSPIRSVRDTELKHALRLWWEDPEQEGYIQMDLTNFCAWMPPHEEEGYNAFDPTYQYTGSEGGTAGDYQSFFGLSAYPSIAVDVYGNLAISWCSPDLNRDMYNGIYYMRTPFVKYKPANVPYWWQVNYHGTSMYQDLIHTGDEATCITAVSGSVNPNEFWFSCLSDDTPGFHIGSITSQPNISTSTVNVFKFTPAEGYEGDEDFDNPTYPEQPSNHWTPDESLYANNMTIITTVEIEGVEQATDNIEIGAFCGDELRGSGRLQYVNEPANRYECFLMLYGKAGDNITFKIYDHATASELNLKTDMTVTFEANGAIGDVTSPATMNFSAGEIITAVANPVEGGTIEGAGNYSVGDTVTLKAIENEGYIFLNWTENGTVVSEEYEYSFVVELGRNLVANFETAYWTADANIYPNNMTVITTVTIDSVEQSNTRLEVGAFCGDELRGSGRLQYVPAPVNKYEAFIMIYGEDNDSITFKLYNHSTAIVLDLVGNDTVVFKVNETIGSVVEPHNIIFTTKTDNPDGPGDEPDEPKLDAPQNVKANAISTSSIIVTWDFVENAKSYNVYRNDELIENVKGTNYMDEGLEYNTEYCYTVRAIGDEVESALSEKVCVKTLGEGIEELTSSVNIYPNPVQDKLYIEAEAEIEDVVVYDVYGRRQVTETPSHQGNLSVDVSDLNSGVYFVKVVTENGNIVKRIIKN